VRGLCVIIQNRSDSVDSEVQPLLEVHKGVVAPDVLSNFFPRYQLAGATGEQSEHLERLRLQINAPSGFPQLAGL
jgi:hypothetical protein